ncbi:carboxypeptidase-like regulatory domain-containing protein [Aureitalea sp. L0-47]|uniref:carboxypeptidase-like regulatory domain-containing protein n=1 Tax=Aureitalea sp. L0-47 TaxID=2816962 RepID=UPI0022383EA4|nr:carboxypeptidase-like regulatory domain-containing protein [Aureitalea sp. L0-47]MCW5518228.1 carboxypeptidase-like regulatory domain-containing protein [Aureitalea sp. L0-47]
MKKITLPLFLLFCFFSIAQENIIITATLIDESSGKPVEFANIGFEGRGVGTVSTQRGEFELYLKPGFVAQEYELMISCIGYETIRLPYTSWIGFTNSEEKIFLKPQTTELDPVVILSGKREYEKLGSETYSLSELGYWVDKDALGGELASRITIQNERTRLHNFKFHVIRNEADSVKVRINIYSCRNNMPGDNLLSESIYHTISQAKGIEEISFKDHNIVVDEDIVVGIEMVEAYGEDLYLSVSATPFGGTAYLRERSMAHWDVRWNFGLAFGMLSSYPANRASP